MFQVISQRYERGSIALTTNKPFKQWAAIFNNDSTIASAVLDRLLHHADTILIEAPSYRMKDLAGEEAARAACRAGSLRVEKSIEVRLKNFFTTLVNLDRESTKS